MATAHIPHADRGFIAVFSASYFPDAQIVLEWVREDGGGNVYRWAEKGMEGWHCPALLKYFEEAPAKLHIPGEGGGVIGVARRENREIDFKIPVGYGPI